MSVIGNPVAFPPAEINLLDGATWVDGYYLNSSGNPQAAGTSADIYTSNYIDISDCYNSTFIAITKSTFSNEPWIGLCFYNASQGHITRQTSTNKMLFDGYYYDWLVYHPTNANIRYVRFSTRTYSNDVEVLLTTIDKLPLILRPFGSS